MRINQLSGAPVGMNVFNDLLAASTSMAATLKVIGNKPLDPLGSAMLECAVDDLLDAVLGVSKAAPGVGHTFDVDTGRDMVNEDRPAWPVTARADEDTLDNLTDLGYFDHFHPADRDKVRAALETLDGARFEVLHLGPGDLCPVGLIDHVARIVQLALTGRSTTDWMMD